MPNDEIPTDFDFPGTPYAVQRQLMDALYTTMAAGGIGLFESPTGTGKTLSIICATLTWLNRNRSPKSLTQGSGSADSTTDLEEPSWVTEQTEQRNADDAEDHLLRRARAYAARVKFAAGASTLLPGVRAGHTASERVPGRRRGRKGGNQENMDDLFADLDPSDAETMPVSAGGKGKSTPLWRAVNLEGERKSRTVRVIFATRTHSQLAQFVQELRKTHFNPPGLAEAYARIRALNESGLEDPSEDASSAWLPPYETPLSIVLFGSRKQMCVNEEVRKLGAANAITERCRELIEVTEASTGKRKRNRATCVYHDDDTESLLKDRLLIGSHEIEDVARMGRQLGACPYFAMRSAVSEGHAEVIGAPYSAVLHAGTRENVGISIDEDTVVVFDEGHNVNAAVRELHSCAISGDGLKYAISALKGYMSCYEGRFTSSNLFKLRQIVTVAEGFLTVLSQGTRDRVVGAADLVFEAGVDNVNMIDLVSYMKDAKLSKKLRGFVEMAGYQSAKCASSLNKDEASIKQERMSKQSIAVFQRLIECICECGDFGRVAINPIRSASRGVEVGKFGTRTEEPSGRLKYFVVEAGQLFASSMSKARCILFVGGTLSPRQSMIEGLLGNMGRGEVVEFECDHVVPRRNVMALVCGQGPRGVELEFTYRNRKSFAMIDELGRTIEHSVKKVNGGVVIFFSSYDLMGCVLQRWKQSGQIGVLSAVKPLVVEERTGNDSSLKDYQTHVSSDSHKAGMLLAVMGGKLSEGINFCDDLGRMVIVVGMPFGNATDLETAEVLKNLKSPRQRNEYLENECITVVNQSIGRAVRHAADFAAIVLLDRRFCRPQVVQKLPTFIKRDLACVSSFNALQGHISSFFALHKK